MVITGMTEIVCRMPCNTHQADKADKAEPEGEYCLAEEVTEARPVIWSSSTLRADRFLLGITIEMRSRVSSLQPRTEAGTASLGKVEAEAEAEHLKQCSLGIPGLALFPPKLCLPHRVARDRFPMETPPCTVQQEA